MAERTGAQAVVESLIAQGVDTAFGIISTHMMDVYDTLYDHQDAIRFISTRHEHAAAMMADGYSRATGKPGVCLTSTGPGAANSMGGMGEAYFASSPVLNVTSTAEEHLYGRGLGEVHAIKNQLGMFEAVTQWSHHITNQAEIPDRVYDAFERFGTRRPRPIEIEIPVDLQSRTADMEIPQSSDFRPPGADPDAIERAARLLLSGKRVAIWAGTGVHRSGATPKLVKLAETLGIPVLASADGKGAIPDDHPLFLGVLTGFPGSAIGADSADDPLRIFVESLDTLLVVGSSLQHTRTKALGLQLPKNLIHVDIDPDAIGRLYDTAAGVVGDAGVVVEQLVSVVQGKSSELDTGFDEETRQVKKKISAYWWDTMPNQMRTMKVIREATARDAIFFGDVNVSTHSGAVYCLPIFEPRTFMTSAWGGLGFAFPGSVGAKAGLPDRQVVCITGDGGFQFNIQELGTCVQYGLNPVVMVFNDNAWGVLKGQQKSRYNGRFIASDLHNPDFVKLAESYGANAARVTSVEEIAPALESALKSDVVTLIEVLTPDGFDNFT